MNTQFTFIPYLVFLGGLLVIALICLLDQLSKTPTDAELERPLPEAANDMSDPANWPPPADLEFKSRAQGLIAIQRDELLFQP